MMAMSGQAALGPPTRLEAIRRSASRADGSQPTTHRLGARVSCKRAGPARLICLGRPHGATVVGALLATVAIGLGVRGLIEKVGAQGLGALRGVGVIATTPVCAGCS